MNGYSEHVTAKRSIYEHALEAGGFDAAIVAAGALVYPFADDLDYPFRANPYFSEWVPVQDRPASYLILRSGRQPELLLPAPGGFWDSPPSDPPGWVADALSFSYYAGHTELRSHLMALGRTVWIGEPEPILDSLHATEHNATAVTDFVDYHRAYKTEYEIACLREASHRAAIGHRAARTAFLEGGSELEIHLAFLAATRCADEELPYRSIVAVNENAATLHHTVRAKKVPENARSFLIDAGQACRGYASDVSRTHVAATESDSRFAGLIADLDKLQQQLVTGVNTAKGFPELHELAHEGVTELLVEHEIVSGGLEQAMASGVSRIFFPHGLGHLLGIQVHDLGGHMAAPDGTLAPPPENHPHLRFTRALERSMVFTIEPGIYFIPALITEFEQQSLLNHSVIEELGKYGGIRIEDNVLITATGTENLTRDAFF